MAQSLIRGCTVYLPERKKEHIQFFEALVTSKFYFTSFEIGEIIIATLQIMLLIFAQFKEVPVLSRYLIILTKKNHENGFNIIVFLSQL